MNSEFDINEKLYRAIIPLEPFKKIDGSISSGAFRDKNGLSVDRQMGRENKEAVNFMKRLNGDIVSVTVQDCVDCAAVCTYCPLDINEYHSEIHKDNKTKLLSKGQAKKLASKCKIEFESNDV